MSEPREAWGEVGRRFEELGRTLREHFGGPEGEQPAGAAGAAGAGGPSGAAGGAAGGGAAGGGAAGGGGQPEARAAVEDAVRRFREAAQRLGDQAGDAVRDPAVRDTAQRATRSLADALEATFGQLGEQLRSRAGRTGAGAGGATDGAAAEDPRALPGPYSEPGAGPGDEPLTGGAPTRPPADS